jgi:pimeloyl-ACP methyl ester carboxylesterase
MKRFILGDDIAFKFKVPYLACLYNIHLRKITDHGVLHSYATFYPDHDGCIANSTSYSLCGSYTGIDKAGLFWSLRPIESNLSAFLPVVNANSDKIIFRIDLEYDGKIITSNVFEQIYADETIESIILNDELKGAFYQNKKTASKNILFVHGSGASDENYEHIASTFALKGFNTLMIEYGTQTKLEEIPLEYFKKGIDYLIEHSNATTKKVILFGISKGGEAVLLLSSIYPECIAAVCACSPLTAPYQSIDKDRPPNIDPRSSWTIKKRPIPFVNMNTDLIAPFDPTKQLDIFLFYCGVFKDRKEFYAKVMDISKFNGPVLLLTGKEDRICPASVLCDMLIEKNKSVNIQHKTWLDAGHVIGWPGYQEIFHFSMGPFLFSGTDKGNGKAARESWREIIRFFENN